MKEQKKASVKKAPAKARKPAIKPVAAAAAASRQPALSPEERYKMIQEAAYYIAERHGFNGDSAYFWSQAEAEINGRFS